MISETTTTVLIDSNIWIEYFIKGKKDEKCAPLIERATIEHNITPSIILFEVFKKLNQQKGIEVAIKSVSYICNQTTIIDMDQIVAVKAAKISNEHQLHMADAMIKATAEINHARLFTMDTHFTGLENVEII